MPVNRDRPAEQHTKTFPFEPRPYHWLIIFGPYSPPSLVSAGLGTHFDFSFCSNFNFYARFVDYRRYYDMKWKIGFHPHSSYLMMFMDLGSWIAGSFHQSHHPQPMNSIYWYLGELCKSDLPDFEISCLIVDTCLSGVCLILESLLCHLICSYVVPPSHPTLLLNVVNNFQKDSHLSRGTVAELFLYLCMYCSKVLDRTLVPGFSCPIMFSSCRFYFTCLEYI
jgi:hypothetical protein